MSLWIKICGNTSLADANLAAQAGADAVGFVFAPSPRRVTSEAVATIVPQLPPTLEKIGVLVDASFDEITATIETCSLTGVQLHFDASPELTARLRMRFGAALRILRVLHFESSAAQKPDLVHDPNIDGILVDSRTAEVIGGTGAVYDWSLASDTLFHSDNAPASHMIVAGGLTPENVAQAIAALHPWGVDVVTGVEAGPGRKDPAKVRAFIANARAASHK